MTVNSSANSVILILFAFSDNLSAENSKLSAESWHRGHHLLVCMCVILIRNKTTFSALILGFKPKKLVGGDGFHPTVILYVLDLSEEH